MKQSQLPPILFISAGMLEPKKREHAMARRQLYLNYGALMLATLCDQWGFPTRLIHGEHQDPRDFARALYVERRLRTDAPLMLSIPSFYALSWAQLFCQEVKRLVPRIRIIVGGRWVTSPDPNWIKTKLPEAAEIVGGLGETLLPALLRTSVPSFHGTGTEIKDDGLHHRLVDGYRRYQPSIEMSRGCGMGCAFCEERSIKLTKLRAPGSLADLLLELVEDYDSEDIHPYLQSSFFLPNPRWAERLAIEVASRGVKVGWRCETRVDGMKPDTVAALASAGLKVIDLGLETASPHQILAMRKASDADRYLRAASDLIRACAENGVWVKANILLYAGETPDTLRETGDWLDGHANLIKGISVGPVVAYGPPSQITPFLGEMEVLGASPTDPASSHEHGITHFNLSHFLSAKEAEVVSLELSRQHMDANDYFDLKSFSYYPRDYTRMNFDADIGASNANCLPFRQTSRANHVNFP